jgi:hypothetical protein
MPRGINWDELPNNYAKFRPSTEVVKKNDQEEVFVQREFDFQRDSVLIGKRAAFGVIVSAETFHFIFQYSLLEFV